MNKLLYNQIKIFSAKLNPLYQNASYQEQILWWMLEAITGKSQAQLIASENFLTNEHMLKLEDWINKHIDNNMPLQYIIGSVPFVNCTILVEPPILIPRPETEEWVCNLITQLQKLQNRKITILDLCTGSGALACAFAKAFPEATIFATDISECALSLAQKNAAFNGITSITFIKSDLFNALQGKKFDLIVTNPPYLSHEEWLVTDPMVHKWEDYNALVATDNGLKLINDIITQAPDYLHNTNEFERNEIPQLSIEIGYKQGMFVQNIMKKYFVRTTIFKDYAQNDRLVTGCYKK